MGFDALRSTIGRSVMWEFSEYVPVVADYIEQIAYSLVMVMENISNMR